MTRCIIHIGMHKTGSASIQHSLHGFSDDRFVYAGLGTSGNHSIAMSCLFAERPEMHRVHRARDMAAVADYMTKLRADLERVVKAAQGRTLIISGEGISARLQQPELARIREYFRGRFKEVTIVGYVRPPGGYITSGFQQRVKDGAVTRFNLRREYPDYRTRFEKFDDVFGRENVELRKFEPGGFPGGCAVQDFCARLDISFSSGRIVRFNESLPRQAVNLLYTYRKLGQKYGPNTMAPQERQQLSGLLASLDSEKFRFSPDVIKPVLRTNRGDIAWMEARLGQSLHEELGEHLPGDVRDERDLFGTSPETMSKLRALLGDAPLACAQGETPEEAALLVHRLRESMNRRGIRKWWAATFKKTVPV